MARTDFEPLTWEEAEQNRQDSLENEFAPLVRADPPGFPARHHVTASSPPSVTYIPVARSGHESKAETRDRLRSELKRGREYLRQAEKDLAESRALLEDWPAYEHICGDNPLAHLTQSVLFNEQIARFLGAWLKRREDELEALAQPARSSLALAPVQHRKALRGASGRKSPSHRSARLKPPVRAARAP